MSSSDINTLKEILDVAVIGAVLVVILGMALVYWIRP